MNKDKKQIIRPISGKEFVMYRCNRCGVLVPEEYWKNDTHEDCDRLLAGKTIRKRAEGRALRIFGKRR